MFPDVDLKLSYTHVHTHTHMCTCTLTCGYPHICRVWKHEMKSKVFFFKDGGHVAGFWSIPCIGQSAPRGHGVGAKP